MSEGVWLVIVVHAAGKSTIAQRLASRFDRSTETNFDLRDVERLAATLHAVSLDEKDRATLHAVFALAGQAAAGGSDKVSGFSIVYQRPDSRTVGE